MLSTMAMSALFMMPHSQHAFDTAFRQRNIGLDSAYSRSLTSVHISPRVLTATRRLASSFASEISTVPSTNTVVGLTEHFVSDTIVSKSNLGLRIALPASVRSFGCEYCSALKSWPLRTNALTSALLFALGDVVAQIETGSRFLGTSSTPWMLRPLMLDFSRLVKYSFTGVGYGVIWSYWYNASDTFTRAAFSSNLIRRGWSAFAVRVTRTTAAIVLEQVVMQPINYGLYIIPLTTALNGGGLATIASEVHRHLPMLLWESAKFWTLANVIIYTLPLRFQVSVSNVFDFAWSIFLSMAATSNLLFEA